MALFLLVLVERVFSSVVATVPSRASVTPNTGPIGSAVTIAGANFRANPSSNIVVFGTVRANVSTATARTLGTLVPAGAGYAPGTVTAGGSGSYITQQLEPDPGCPQMITHSQDFVAAEGTSQTLTALASGEEVGYQWLKDGTVISGATAPTLEVPSLSERTSAYTE